MKTLSLAVAISSLMATAIMAEEQGEPAGGKETAVQPKLAVTLRDGSCILGSVACTKLSLASAVGDVSVPLDKISTVTFAADTEKAVVSLLNGDRLSGMFDFDVIEMESIMGTLKIPRKEMVSLAMRSGGDSARGLLLHYTFDERDGSTVRDESGNQRDGRIVGALRVNDGKHGGAIRVGSGIGYVTTPDTPAWAFGTKPFSVCAWVCLNQPTHNVELIAGTTEGGGTMPKWVVQLSDGNIALVVSDMRRVDYLASAPWPDGQGVWHHVAITRDGNVFRTYLDGKCVSKEEKAVALSDVRAPLTIGQAESLYVSGLIDDFRVYDRALGEDEVSMLAQ